MDLSLPARPVVGRRTFVIVILENTFTGLFACGYAVLGCCKIAWTCSMKYVVLNVLEASVDAKTNQALAKQAQSYWIS